MAFRFRQFTVEDDRSTLKIGTDAMLLGAWADPGLARNILDIGTGCGVLSLMMAQKTAATIHAIDIDRDSILQARNNFSNSPWNDRLTAESTSLGDLTSRSGPGFDFIISNPPYFSNSLRSPSTRQNLARHDAGLTLPDLVRGASLLLNTPGRFALVLPASFDTSLTELCHAHALFPVRKMRVFHKPGGPSARVLLEFGRTMTDSVQEEKLILRNQAGGYSPEYLTLTREYHYF